MQRGFVETSTRTSRLYERVFVGGRLKLSPAVRSAVDRRCAGACEGCGLQWPWLLYLFRLDETGRDTAPNLVVLCSRCSDGRAGAFAPLVAERTLRARLLAVSNARAGVLPLTPARRRTLIESRGGACELCGISAGQRTLEVHHKLGVLQGGDDREQNLQVLCFACHHRLLPCVTGCGAWAGRSSRICRHCVTRKRLEDLMPELSWEQIKSRYPAVARGWKDGYEPRPLAGPPAWSNDHRSDPGSTLYGAPAHRPQPGRPALRRSTEAW